MRESDGIEHVPWVEVIYWDRDKKDQGMHHVALGITSNEHSYEKYVSYHPAVKARYYNCWSTVGKFKTWQYDENNHCNPVQKIKITGLDIKKILNKIHVLEESVQNNEWIWSVWSDFLQRNIFAIRRLHGHCCSMAMLLLKEGGLSKLLPGFNRFGSLKHILVLSTRIFSMAPWYSQGIYQIILDSHTHYTYDSAILPMLLLSILNGIPIFFIERKWHPRKLIENNHGDYLVSYLSSVSCVLSMVAYRKWLEPLMLGLPSWQIVLFDLFSFFLFAFVFLFTGKVVSKLVYSVLGMEYVNTPKGMLSLARYLNKLNELPTSLRKTLFYKEVSLSLIYLMGYASVNIARKFIHERTASACVGYSAAIILSFCVIKIIHWRLNKRHHDAIDVEKQFLKDYSTPVNSLFFTLFLSIACAFGGTRLFLSLYDANPWLLSLFTTLSSFAGYVMAIGLLKLGGFIYHKIKKRKGTEGLIVEKVEADERYENNSRHLNHCKHLCRLWACPRRRDLEMEKETVEWLRLFPILLMSLCCICSLILGITSAIGTAIFGFFGQEASSQNSMVFYGFLTGVGVATGLCIIFCFTALLRGYKIYADSCAVKDRKVQELDQSVQYQV